VIRHLSFAEVLELHQLILARWGGAQGVRDIPALESSVAQPRMTFEGRDLYPDLASKAAALCFSLVRNHPFVDGNKRVGHAAMEVFLLLNGYELNAAVDQQEHLMLKLAAGNLTQEELTNWMSQHLRPT
jgi:death-on-curing protein